MKYIDAEKLIAEIDDRLHCNGAYDEVGDSSWHYDQGMVDAYKHLREVVTSLKQEQPKEICSKCIHHGKDDDYCYYPHGGMQSLINENGVYECTGFYEKEQEQPEVDLKEEISRFIRKYFVLPSYEYDSIAEVDWEKSMEECARYFYELGRNARKEE